MFQPYADWESNPDEVIVHLGQKWVYRGPKELWEEIYRAYPHLSYGGQGLQVNQICRRFDIPRKTFLAIKSVLGLTHTSVPYPPWVMVQENPSELVQKSLERKEEDYQRRLEARAPEWYRKEYEKLLQKQYNQNRLVRVLTRAIRDAPVLDPGQIPAKKKLSPHRRDLLTLLLNLTDWHAGKAVLQHDVVAAGAFNTDVLTERVERLAELVIAFYNQHEKDIREVVIPSLVDIVDNPLVDTYPNQMAFQDCHDTEQVRLTVELLHGFFSTLLKHIPLKITVMAHRGNHGLRGRPLSGIFDELLFDPMLKMWFRNVDRIQIKTHAGILSTYRTGDVLCAFSHGAGTGRNLQEGTAYRMAALAEIAADSRRWAKWRYLFLGHWHHRMSGGLLAKEGVHLEWIHCPSLVGGDSYAETKLFATSRPAQTAYLIHAHEGLQTTRVFYLD